jgi:hypothetical protein
MVEVEQKRRVEKKRRKTKELNGEGGKPVTFIQLPASANAVEASDPRMKQHTVQG